MPMVTIEVPSGATLKDLERYFSESDRFKAWAEETNSRVVGEMSQAIDGLKTSFGQMADAVTRAQQDAGKQADKAMKASKPQDLTPLLKQNQQALGALVTEMGKIAARVNALEVNIPEPPKPKAFDVQRKKDRNGLPLIERVEIQY